MSLDKEELNGIAEFKPTMELQWLQYNIKLDEKRSAVGKKLQQKWTNELGEEQWRDIPLVISE